MGLRDRAIILTLTLTGRRRSEVLNLKAGDLSQEGETVLYSYRGKGGKHGKRELPQPAFRAIQQALEAFGKEFATLSPNASLWPSSADCERGITSGTFYGNLRRYFKAAGVVTAKELWSKNRLTCSTDSPASLLSLAAECLCILGNWKATGTLPGSRWRKRWPLIFATFPFHVIPGWSYFPLNPQSGRP